METTIRQFVHSATEVIAVRYHGDPDEARLLIANGWLSGSDLGFGRDNAGQNVVRGMIPGRVVFPGDVLVLHPNWELEAYDFSVFQQRYEEPEDLAVITDGKEDSTEADLLAKLPTGENPEAVALEEPPKAFDDPAQGTGTMSSYS